MSQPFTPLGRWARRVVRRLLGRPAPTRRRQAKTTLYELMKQPAEGKA
jgi:hypothetical protein